MRCYDVLIEIGLCTPKKPKNCLVFFWYEVETKRSWFESQLQHLPCCFVFERDMKLNCCMYVYLKRKYVRDWGSFLVFCSHQFIFFFLPIPLYCVHNLIVFKIYLGSAEYLKNCNIMKPDHTTGNTNAFKGHNKNCFAFVSFANPKPMWGCLQVCRWAGIAPRRYNLSCYQTVTHQLCSTTRSDGIQRASCCQPSQSRSPIYQHCVNIS